MFEHEFELPQFIIDSEHKDTHNGQTHMHKAKTTNDYHIQHSILNNNSDFKCDKNSNLFHFLPSYTQCTLARTAVSEKSDGRNKLLLCSG